MQSRCSVSNGCRDQDAWDLRSQTQDEALNVNLCWKLWQLPRNLRAMVKMKSRENAVKCLPGLGMGDMVFSKGPEWSLGLLLSISSIFCLLPSPAPREPQLLTSRSTVLIHVLVEKSHVLPTPPHCKSQGDKDTSDHLPLDVPTTLT